MTVFCAKDLIYVDAVLAVVVILAIMRRAPRSRWVPYATTVLLLLVLSFAASRVAGALYDNPRPFVVEHVKPMTPHAADNGFPSDHALFAAAIVAAVALADVAWCIPFVVLAGLIDWGRVATRLHHAIDVVGAAAIVAAATAIALPAIAIVRNRFRLPGQGRDRAPQL